MMLAQQERGIYLKKAFHVPTQNELRSKTDQKNIYDDVISANHISYCISGITTSSKTLQKHSFSICKAEDFYSTKLAMFSKHCHKDKFRKQRANITSLRTYLLTQICKHAITSTFAPQMYKMLLSTCG
jgi:hypothetical protein